MAESSPTAATRQLAPPAPEKGISTTSSEAGRASAATSMTDDQEDGDEYSGDERKTEEEDDDGDEEEEDEEEEDCEQQLLHTEFISFKPTDILRVLLVDPITQHRCCLGCVSLADAVHLICSIEFFLLIIFLFCGIEMSLRDGLAFYTSEFHGYGTVIAWTSAIFFVISMFINAFTSLACRLKKQKFYAIHIGWQIFVIAALLFLIVFVYRRMYAGDEVPHEHHILKPSGCVIIAICTFFCLLELWWTLVFVDAMFYQNYEDEHPEVRRRYEQAGGGARFIV